MADILVGDGTAITWTDGGTYELDLGSLANDDAWQGAKGDLGATRARQYTVEVTIDPNVAPTDPDAVIDIYWSASASATAGTGNVGGTSGTNLAFESTIADVNEKVRHMIHIGSFALTADAEPQTTMFYGFEPPARYGMPVVVNRCGETLDSTDTSHSVILRPLEDQTA